MDEKRLSRRGRTRARLRAERAAPQGAFRLSLAKEKGSIIRVGILGSGLMGGKLGPIFARAGHEVVFARSGQNPHATGASNPLPERRRGLVSSGREKHWHGATQTAAMTHMVIQEQLNSTGKVVDWMKKVSDEQYQK
ncbi:MAG TPA: hypothetical protein VIS96_00370 [Terrimicrobiaceae bacterium]